MDDDVQMTMSPAQSLTAGGQGDGEQEEEEEEEEDLFYIPPRRPSLDLGPPPSANQLGYISPPASPVQSYTSMTSGISSEEVEAPHDADTGLFLHRTASSSSGCSDDSCECGRTRPRRAEATSGASLSSGAPQDPQEANEFRHPSLTVAFVFKAISRSLQQLPQKKQHLFRRRLWKQYTQPSSPTPLHLDSQDPWDTVETVDLVDTVDRLLECYSLEESLVITKNLLMEMQQKQIVEQLHRMCLQNETRHELQEFLKNKYSKDSSVDGEQPSFDDVFADLYVSTCGDYGPNTEHEVLSIRKLHTNHRPQEQLHYQDIFSAENMRRCHAELVLLSGVAGSGKSMLVRKLVMDWAEGRSNQHVTFLFPFTFRELQQSEDCEVSLLTLLGRLYPPTQRLSLDDLRSNDCTVLFVADGLDEYNRKLDFFNTELYGSDAPPTSPNVLVVNLLRARLLFGALFLVTTRSQVRHSIPWDTPCHEIQLHGFCGTSKELYFQQRFKDPHQARRVLAHVESSRTLHIMCHLPLFCSLLADECQRVFREHGEQAALPGSLTPIYTKLLLELTRRRRSLRVPDRSAEQERDFLMKLGRLAFRMLEEGSFVLSRSHEDESFGVTEEEMVDHSGLCTQFMVRPHVLHVEKAFSFIHPSLQEYMAALYTFLSFINHGENILEQGHRTRSASVSADMMELYRSALDRSLHHEDGTLDLFLRFLCGMLAKRNLDLLQPLGSSSKWPFVIKEVTALLTKTIRDNQHPRRTGNLHRCLLELTGT